MSDVFFEINPKVVHEGIDNEVILINLDSGNYYSLRKVAGLIWQMLQNSYSQEQIISSITKACQQEEGAIKQEIDNFLDQLKEEELIKQSEQQKHADVQESLADLDVPTQYETPLFEKYSDMQELLLIDPIHEVDEAGWPQKNSETATNE